MKKLEIWVNEYEYQKFLDRARLLGMTPYGLLKKLALEYLHKV